MATNPSESLRRHWEKHFKSLDKDGNDSLTSDELSRGLAERGVRVSSVALKDGASAVRNAIKRETAAISDKVKHETQGITSKIKEGGTSFTSKIKQETASLGSKIKHETQSIGKKLKTALNSVDPNNDGKVTKDEFVDIMCRPSLKNKQQLIDVFKRIDRDNDGFVTQDELYKALEEAGERIDSENIRSAIQEVDKDRDGKISYEEFMKFCM